MKRGQVFEEALVNYAQGPSRRGFIRLAASAFGMVFAGGAIATAPPVWADEDCTVEYPPADLDDCPNKRRHPGHEPTFNGCGAEGDDLPVPQGFGWADFRPACNEHDICYGTCGTNRLKCDANLADGIADICNEAYAYGLMPLMHKVCMTMASAYGLAVATRGTGPFEDAQKEDCECCRPYDDTPNLSWCPCDEQCYPSATECEAACTGYGLSCLGSCVSATAEQCPA